MKILVAEKVGTLSGECVEVLEKSVRLPVSPIQSTLKGQEENQFVVWGYTAD